jgi:hypothetical protein
MLQGLSSNSHFDQTITSHSIVIPANAGMTIGWPKAADNSKGCGSFAAHSKLPEFNKLGKML